MRLLVFASGGTGPRYYDKPWITSPVNSEKYSRQPASTFFVDGVFDLNAPEIHE
jgi:hypothetical protein